jgi:protein-tyrosine phosphatase
MAGMVDIHNHVLPEVDDGADSLETSLEMLRRGAEEGIEAAVLTPHFKPEDDQEKAELHQQRFAQLQEAAAAAGFPVQLFLGAEVGFRFGLAEVARWPGIALAGSRYVLVDLPPGPLPGGLEQGMFELRTAGFRPILGHPERHRQLTGDERQLQRLREQDLLFQLDAGSLTGRFGQRTQEAARMLAQRGWAEFVASDGHNLEKRPFTLAAARQWVEEELGPPEAQLLFADNPGRLVRGEVVALREGRAQTAARRPAAKRRRGWLSRLLGAWK